MSVASELAIMEAYLALVKVLHRNKAIDVADVVTEIGNTIDFQTKHPNANAELLGYLKSHYDSLLALEPHIQQLSAALALKSGTP